MTPGTKGLAKSQASIAAVVVNHNAGAMLVECVASLRAGGIEEIVVVDNASSDGSLAGLAKADRTVLLLPTGENLGYGAGANRGVARTTAEFILICNPDLVVAESAPRRLLDAMQSDGTIGVAGPRIVESDGAVYPSARAFPKLTDAIGHAFVGMFTPTNPWSRRYRREQELGDGTECVDWVSGACMLVRRVAFTSVGGFDEGYFMYVEDLDLCWRLARGAWTTSYVPAATVTHERGLSSKAHPFRLIVAHHLSTWRFVRRSTPAHERALLPIMGLGIAVRLLLALSRQFSEDLRAKVNEATPTVR